MKILFMCVANSARSQLAEALARQILGQKYTIQSAGSQPSRVNPLAITALKEVGIDISQCTSKSTDDLPADFLRDLDRVITLCAEEVCPVVISPAQKLHWPLPDPAGQNHLSPGERLQRFRNTRDELSKRLQDFKRELESK